MSDRVWVIVVAAGSGARFGAVKQLEPLGSGTVLDRSLASALACAGGVVCVTTPEVTRATTLPAEVVVVEGGPTRAASVRAGLAVVPAAAEVILVHDAARPLADAALFRRVVDAVRAGADAAVPVVPVVDTIRSIDGGAVDRDRLRAVQTPQGFRAEVLRAAHAGAGEATDDASLVEAAGGKVVLVEGDPRNVKITTPTDLVVAAALLRP